MRYQRTDLSNDLRVVTHPMKERESVALGIWIGVGGRYEQDQIKGAAHFIEHIAFKGSAKYSCKQIKELIEGVGGTLNAFTSEEQTCFYAKFPTKHLKLTFDILADIILNPQIAAKDVAKERTVIIEEIKMYHDLPQYFVLELLDELLWPNHPLGRNLAGTPETISAMTREVLLNFHRQYYAPGNIVIAAAGHLNHPAIVELVQRKFRKTKPSDGPSYRKADNAQTKPRVHLASKNIEQMHVALGMLGYDEQNNDRYILSLIRIILGGNM